jgi:hypothetical protein
MVANTTTRRALMRGAGITAVLAAAPVVASAMPLPSAIEADWRSRCQAYRILAADPDDKEKNDALDRIEAAEIAILNNPDTSVRAAELRLWIAFESVDHSYNAIPERNRAIEQSDVAYLLTIRENLDWHEKMIFAAILNLRGES